MRAAAACVAGIALVCALISVTHADVYMHNPRGSNNRLNERSANRNNGNRMFDSQNNNRGGYNKGDNSVDAFTDYTGQFDMTFYMSHPSAETTGEGRSILSVEWTNQHGCGGNDHNDPHKLNCNLVLQYMCLPEEVREQTRDSCDEECRIPIPENPNCDPDGPPCGLSPIQDLRRCQDLGMVVADAKMYDRHNCPHNCGNNAAASNEQDCGSSWGRHAGQNGFLRMRDGLNTNRQEYTNPGTLTEQARFARKDGNVVESRGLHEDWDYYDECYRRERNRGLFTADQNLRNNNLGYSSAVFTRQNPNDNRRGYECPEERDYWPYWHPSPWVDIAVMTDRLDMCPFFQSESQNVKGKHFCRNTRQCSNCIRFNNEAQCRANGGRWVLHPPHYRPAPECIQAPWSRVNHLGNGRHGQPNRFNWTLPFLSIGVEPYAEAVPHRCVLRLRYNISTDDYNAWRVNASFNNNDGTGIVSPVRQNPNVDIGAKNTALRLAINTAQFGRTFQDRSHVFRLIPRSDVRYTRNRPRADTQSNPEFFGTRTLYNLNVRGKRGNIVQTFPSVEYDFVPNHLHVSEEDLVHIQWAGSNTHNNGNPAGDGQAGDAGEGRGGTDRHNFVELRRRQFGESFPATWEENTIFKNMLDALDAHADTGDLPHYISTSLDEDRDWEEVKQSWALRMASAGYYRSFNYKDADGDPDPNSVEARTAQLNPLLDNAPASYTGGIFRFARGTYNYMCTRNHNFTNRDQKGHLVVE
eukprot:m.137221 g.137221  ORF g.137221 m.137221 type:complete len:750 (-) comp15888_c0_seq3:485-2734(-)